jgi:hypothetical protein
VSGDVFNSSRRQSHRGEWIKAGAVVIDVGTNVVPGKIHAISIIISQCRRDNEIRHAHDRRRRLRDGEAARQPYHARAGWRRTDDCRHTVGVYAGLYVCMCVLTSAQSHVVAAASRTVE